MFAVGSSYLQEQLNHEEVDTLNNYIEETEKLVELKLDAKVNYKERIIETYKGVQDPFDIEVADLNYEQNPSEPTQPLRNLVFQSN